MQRILQVGTEEEKEKLVAYVKENAAALSQVRVNIRIPAVRSLPVSNPGG